MFMHRIIFRYWNISVIFRLWNNILSYSFLQISASFGISAGDYHIFNADVDYDEKSYPIENGFAYELSLAFDLGGRNNGLLFGVKFQQSTGILAPSGFTGHEFRLGIFTRYAYRNKSSFDNL